MWGGAWDVEGIWVEAEERIKWGQVSARAE